MNDALAVVVPAYKTRFLEAALASIAKGTNAVIYVFDDASPNEVEPIARRVLSTTGAAWSYHRFAENLGGSALTSHFDRCVARTKEPWIWLFSDDDQMEPGCIDAFCRTASETAGQYDVYSFDSVEIDAQSRLVSLHPCLPDWEGWKQFAYFYLQYGRQVPQQAVVFSRAAYERLGGFVKFPLGWTSDQASLLGMAGGRGIKRIPGPKVRFRNSGENLSWSDDSRHSSQKLEAAMQFVGWLLARIEAAPDPSFPLPDDVLRRLTFHWFRRHLVQLHAWFSPAEALKVARFVKDTWGEPYGRALGRMVKLWMTTGVNSLRRTR